VGCRAIPSSSLRPPPAASPSRYEAGRGDEQDDIEPAQCVPTSQAPPSRGDVETAQYVAASEAPPSQDPPPASDPVESGASLTLAEAIDYGLRHNPRLRQASAQVAAARDGAEIAFAPFLPELAYHYIFAGFNEPVIPGGAFVPASLQRGVFSYSLNEFGIQWTILDFGRRGGRYGQALSRARAESLVLERARQTIAFDVASAYFQLLAARAEVRVRAEAMQTAGAIRRDVGTRRLGGTAEREDVLRADVEFSRTAEELVAARQATLDAEALLNQALGCPEGGPLIVADVARRPPFAESLEDCLRRAAAIRPEIGAARQEIAGAAQGERAARGEMLPRIYTRGTVIQAELPRVFHGWIDGAGIHAEQPLYSGGSKRAALRQAHAERDAAVAGLKVILNNVSAQVNLAYNAIATERERTRLSSVAARQARENLRVVVVRYNNGDAIPTEVVDAQTALTTADVRYYTSVYSYLAGLARLDYAQGGDLSELLAQVSQPPEAGDQRIDLPRNPDEPPAAAPLTPPTREPAVEGDLPPALPDRP
jgi:outer membrane protein